MMNKAKVTEQRAISKRLAKALCPEASSSFLVVTDTLVRAWDQAATEPLPDRIAELTKALEEKLNALGNAAA